MRPGIYHLHVYKPHTFPQRITFPSKTARNEYLKLELDKARLLKRQWTYRRGEYLRVYKGPITFVEFDIKPAKTNARETAERLFQ